MKGLRGSPRVRMDLLICRKCEARQVITWTVEAWAAKHPRRLKFQCPACGSWKGHVARKGREKVS